MCACEHTTVMQIQFALGIAIITIKRFLGKLATTQLCIVKDDKLYLLLIFTCQDLNKYKTVVNDVMSKRSAKSTRQSFV
jgi:3-deoxy-D-manno-octulosonic-acid transferase